MQAQRLRRRLLELPYPHRCCSSQRWAAAYPFPRYAENAAPPQKPPFNIAPPPQQHPAFGMPHQLPPWPPLAPPPPPPAGGPPPPPPPFSPQRFMEVKAAVQVQSNESSEAFASLIDSLHKKGLVQEVDRVVQAMNAAQVLLSLPSYRTLIDMYAEQGELDRMDTVYFEMRKATMRLSGHHHQEAQGVPPSPMQRQQASELLAGVMDQCHKRGMHEQVQHVHRAMKAAHLAIPIPLYNILMDTYSQLGDCERMDAAYMEMRHSLAHKRGGLSTSHLFTTPPPPPPPPPPLHPWSPSSSDAKLPPPPPPPPAFHSPPRPPPGFGAGHFQPGPAFQPHLNVPPAHHFQPPPPGFHYPPPPPPPPPSAHVPPVPLPLEGEAHHFQPPPPPPGFHYPPPPPPPPPPLSAHVPPVPVEVEAERGGDDDDDNDESVVEGEGESESPEVEAESEGSVERDDGVAESEEAEENEEATNAERKQPLMESTG